jgi:[acyl-carrier-protein] S-malonyltransferase
VQISTRPTQLGCASRCADGPENELTDTVNAQPAILAASIAALRVLQARRPAPPAFVAGHSLGEFSALVAAGSLAYADAVRLVRERGRLMQAAGAANPGGMAAVLGGERELLDALCAEVAAATGLVVQVANVAPGRSCSRGRTALDRSPRWPKPAASARAAPPVSIAAHSALMQSAAEGFRTALAVVPFETVRAGDRQRRRRALGPAPAIRAEPSRS